MLLAEETGLTVVAVEAGTLDLHVAGGTAWLRRGGSGPTTVVIGSGLLAAGDDVLVQPSSAISVRTLGTAPAVLLLATILTKESPT